MSAKKTKAQDSPAPAEKAQESPAPAAGPETFTTRQPRAGGLYDGEELLERTKPRKKTDQRKDGA